MRRPEHILVIEEDPVLLDQHLAAIDRVGHFGHGLLGLQEAHGRRGRLAPAMLPSRASRSPRAASRHK